MPEARVRLVSDPRFWIALLVGLAIPMGMAALNVAVALLTLGALTFSRSELPELRAHAGLRSLGYAWAVYMLVLLVSALANGLDMAALKVMRGQLLFLLCIPAYLLWRSSSARWGLLLGLGTSWLAMLAYTLFQIYAPRLLPWVMHRPHILHAGAFENALTWTAVLYLAAMMLVAILRQHWKSWVAHLVASLAVIAVVLMAERTYAALAVILWLASMGAFTWRSAAGFGLVGLVLGCLIWQALPVDQKHRFDPERIWRSRTVEVRRDLWIRAADMASSSPWLGVGPGNYGPELQRLQGGPKPYKYRHAHSNIFHALAEAGIVGLFVLLLFQVRWVGLGLRRLRAAPEFVCATLFVVLGGITEANWIDSEVVILSAMITGLALAMVETGAREPQIAIALQD